MIDIEITKQKIINFLKQKGPALPIQIAKQIEMTPMFTSAILSELTNIKQVKTSSLKVGSSPLYYLPRQEQQLENFSDNFGGVEKEAFLKLQQDKILNDKEQTPAIRVALRSIKDFAISFKIQDNLFWKYSFLPEDEFQKLTTRIKPVSQPLKKAAEITKPSPPASASESEQGINTRAKLDNSKPLAPIFKKPKPTKPISRTKKANQNFLEEIKTFLQTKQIEIISLEQFDKRKVIAIVRLHSQPHLLTAFNKKRITEAELIKTYRKAAELNIPYYLIAKAEPTKKMQELSEAYKKLTRIDKI